LVWFINLFICRTIPAPELPDGPAHSLSNNYYYDRDARRACMPDMSVYNATAAKAITAGGENRCSGHHVFLSLLAFGMAVGDQLATKIWCLQ